MNPNTGQPIQDPTPITPPSQDISENLTPEQKAQKEEQQFEKLEEGLGDIFGNVATSVQEPETQKIEEISPMQTLSNPAPIQEVVSKQLTESTPHTMESDLSTQYEGQQVTQQFNDQQQPTTENTGTLESTFGNPISQPVAETPLTQDIETQNIQPIIPQVSNIQEGNTIQVQPSTPVAFQTSQPLTDTAIPSAIIEPTVPAQPEIQSTPIPQTPNSPTQSSILINEEHHSEESSTGTTPTTTTLQPEIQPAPISQIPNSPIPQITNSPTNQAGAIAPQPIPISVASTQPTAIQIPQVTTSPTTPPKVIVKKGSKISPLKFAIGCGLFGFLLIGAIGFVLFFALQNPTQFQGIIGIEGIKTGLKLFAALFFGLLFLGSFILIIFNVYKLATQKTGSKIKYMIGLIFGALLLGGTVFGGIVSFNTINEMIETTGSTDILTPYIKFKDDYKPTTNGYPVIAPTKVLYKVNDTLLSRFLTTNFVNKNINSIKLDCGNELQVLNYNQAQKQFAGQCLYMKKGDYPIKVITNITDKSTGVTEDVTSDRKNFTVFTEISLAPSSGSLTHNDDYDEIIVGKAPIKVNFDSTSIFTDMKLPEYKIQRDLDGDGERDKSDLTNFSYQFREPKIQNIYYTLPGVNNLVYQIDLRVLQNDVPICTISTNPSTKNNTTYSINTSFDTQQVRINSYMYRIKNISTNKFLNNITNKKESFEYDFLAQGNYVVYLDYVTEDGKQGNCESDTIEVGASTFNVDYTFQYKGPDDTMWKPLTNSGIVNFDGKTISTSALPVKLLLTINSISPSSPDAKTAIKLDNQIIQTPNGKSYEITLHNSTHEQISIQVNDSVIQAMSLLEFPIHITQEDIMGKLTIFPDSVGTSPFEVTLDASTTTLTDQDDEIIYFTWDYGDGEIIKNSSQARTKHTYAYNDNSENGGYNPKVTITTKKGKSATFGLENPILVKKPVLNATISIDSHPAQIANVGDKVDFSLHTDGTPTSIKWDFGTSEGIECSDRSCASVPMFFNTPGTYTITATITYKDLNTSSATTKLVVEK